MVNSRNDVKSAENKNSRTSTEDMIFQRALLSDALISLLVNVSEDRIIWYKKQNVKANIYTDIENYDISGSVSFSSMIQKWSALVSENFKEGYINSNSLEQLLHEFDENRSEKSFAFRGMGKDGSEIEIRQEFIFIKDTSSGDLLLFTYLKDETLIHKTEQRVRNTLKSAYESALSANAVKTDFLSRISHDLKTPLNELFGFIEVAKKEAGHCSFSASACTMYKALENVETSARKVLSQTEKLVGMAKLVSDKDVEIKAECSLLNILKNSVEYIKSLYDVSGIQINVDTGGIVHDRVLGDEEQIEKMMSYIIGNAVKFTEKGSVDIVLKENRIGSPIVCCYEFKVRDTGIGIKKEDLKRIFIPFERVYDTRINNSFPSGNGLGLTIAQSIANKFGGSIQVESVFGEGSVFTATFYIEIMQSGRQDNGSANMSAQTAAIAGFLSNISSSDNAAPAVILSGRKKEESLPETFVMPNTPSALKDKKQEQFSVKTLTASEKNLIRPEVLVEEENLCKSFKGKHILIVEDNEINRMIVKDMLESFDISGYEAENGKEALEILENNGDGFFSLVLMDIQMPIMNGYEASVAIRSAKSEYMKSLPIIAVSANSYYEDIQKSLQSGMNDHVPKPLETKVLLSVLNKWIS